MAHLDLSKFIRQGDTVVWGQACAEPTSLVELLLAQASRIGRVRCFIGIPARSAITAATWVPELEVHSYCGSGSNAGLFDEGRLDIWPVHYSQLPDLLVHGPLRADVVLVQVSAADVNGRHSLGLADDYFSGAIDSARVVIAEVNDQVPFTLGARTISADDCSAMLRVSRPPAELPMSSVDQITRATAARVASLIPDGATLQFGIGALPEAVLAELFEHRDLGIHSGVINETAMRLIDAGVANGALKTVDRGVAIGGMITGTADVFRWAHRNRAVELRPTSYTHHPEVLSTAHRLVAINAAIEVDLTGQVNAEVAAGRYVGALGGAVDFLRGAGRASGGIPIVALPSTHRGRSRIVASLAGPVSTPRSEGVVVVTEHGHADLRGLALRERVEKMIAIAGPDFRADLATATTELLGRRSFRGDA